MKQILCLLFFVGLGHAAHSYDPTEYISKDNSIPKEFEGVGIEEKLSADLSKVQATFYDEEGQSRPFSHWLKSGKPVVLSLVYYSCPSLCNLHLNGVFDVMKQMDLKPGKDYELVAVSFEPKETYDLAAAKKVAYKEKYGFENGIHFLTGDETEVKELAEAIGFTYKWDSQSKEWAHASAAALLTPEGVISRYLHGVHFNPKVFRLSLVEASKGLIGDFIDSVVLFCFRYDPKGNKYSVYSFNVMRLAAGLITILLALWLIPVWLRDRRQK